MKKKQEILHVNFTQKTLFLQQNKNKCNLGANLNEYVPDANLTTRTCNKYLYILQICDHFDKRLAYSVLGVVDKEKHTIQ